VIGTVWITCDKERLPGSSLCRKHVQSDLNNEKRVIQKLKLGIAGCQKRIAKLRKLLRAR